MTVTLRDCPFRKIYRRVFLLTPEGSGALPPGPKKKQSYAAACFVSHTEGMVIALLARAELSEGRLQLNADGEAEYSLLQPAAVPALAAAELTLLPEGAQPALAQRFAAPLAHLSARYAADENIELTRSIELLDAHRLPLRPDDIRVLLGRESSERDPEECILRCERLANPQLIGTVISENSAGVPQGTQLPFVIVRQPERENRVVCLAVVA